MGISVKPFGRLPDGKQVNLYMLENGQGMKAGILDWGATIYSLVAPDKNGNPGDITLGYEGLDTYLNNPEFFGTVVGRNCNRVENAIACIDGREYQLDINDGKHNLHNGNKGFQFKLFEAKTEEQPVPKVMMSASIKDMEDRWPGTVTLDVTYSLTADNILQIEYHGVSDKTTVMNFTNHAYFNLAGHQSGTIAGHRMQINANFYTPSRADCIPTGEICAVKGTPMDFTMGEQLGERLYSGFEQIKQFKGFDHNFVLDGRGYRKIASVSEPESGRVMDVFSDLPGVQFYSGNFIQGCHLYKEQAAYRPHHGFCLETQYFPNSVNIPWFPSCIFKAGEVYTSKTAYQFSVLAK